MHSASISNSSEILLKIKKKINILADNDCLRHCSFKTQQK